MTDTPVVTRDFILNLRFTDYSPPDFDPSISNPVVISMIYNLLSYCEDKRSFGQSDFKTLHEEYTSLNPITKKIVLCNSKKSIINSFSIPELTKLGVDDNVFQQWQKQIKQLSSLKKQKNS